MLPDREIRTVNAYMYVQSIYFSPSQMNTQYVYFSLFNMIQALMLRRHVSQKKYCGKRELSEDNRARLMGACLSELQSKLAYKGGTMKYRPR